MTPTLTPLTLLELFARIYGALWILTALLYLAWHILALRAWVVAWPRLRWPRAWVRRGVEVEA